MSALIKKTKPTLEATTEKKAVKSPTNFNLQSKRMVLRPIISEKAYGQSQALNTYIFKVPIASNKHTISEAVNVQFDVQVVDIKTARINGKKKNTVHKSGRRPAGSRNDYKKAYVTLLSGQSIPIFAKEIEEEQKAVKAAEKLAKKDKK